MPRQGKNIGRKGIYITEGGGRICILGAMPPSQPVGSNPKEVIMNKTVLIATAVVVLLFSCAPITQYPIHLRYAPEGERPQPSAELKGHVVTVTSLRDNRSVSDREILGQWVDNKDKVIPFVSSHGSPATSVTRAFEAYLSQRGYTVRGEPRSWDLNPQSISPKWGDWVIGGSIEELSVEARAEGVKVIYDYKLKLTVVVADVTEKKKKYEDTLESSASDERAAFSPTAAERKINKMLTEAVERMLDHIEKK
jgi:hypothetical protein